MIGDSVVRQLFYSFVKKILPDISTEGDRHSDIYFQDTASGTAFEFYWDPVLNSTTIMGIQDPPTSQKALSQEQLPSIFLVGSGLWFLRYSEWTGGMEQWRQRMNGLVQAMSQHGQTSLAENLFILPISAVDTDKLSEERLRTLLPNDINDMNNYLRNVTKASLITVPFSWNEMTRTAASATKDGLHYAEKIMTAEADVLLNFVCNNKLPKVRPIAATCCYDYPHNHGVQTLMLSIFLVWLPMGYIVQTYRTGLFDKENKIFSWSSFSLFVFLSALVGGLTLKKADKDQALLNRDQTDEWKGWMQIIILIYHYVGASNVSAIYNPVRVLVAGYLFMTGFGHFVFFYKKADFGFVRVASIVTRLNLLTILLTYTMNTTYLSYYFAPLVSFFYLIIYVMMYIGHSHNQNPTFIVSKIVLTALFTAMLVHTPVVLDSAFDFLHFLFGVSWSAEEWRFRLQLDLWIVFVGALFAFGFIKAQDLSISKHPQWGTIKQTTIAASIFGIFGYFVFEVSMPKLEYNQYHPYISWIPILAFVILRNSTAWLRNTTSTFYTFIGKCSLETFICQFHIWLAGDTKGILVLTPWTDGTVAGIFNFAISTLLFVGVAHVLSGATGELTDWLITGREPKASLSQYMTIPLLGQRQQQQQQQQQSPPASTPLSASFSGQEREIGSVLPIVRRQSVMLSPIAASAGSMGPSTLNSLMEGSLSGEGSSLSPRANNDDHDFGSQKIENLSRGTLKDLNQEQATTQGSLTLDRNDERGKRGMISLQIDTTNSTAGRAESSQILSFAPSTMPSPSPRNITFKSLWMQPLWKVVIFFGFVWLLNSAPALVEQMLVSAEDPATEIAKVAAPPDPAPHSTTTVQDPGHANVPDSLSSPSSSEQIKVTEEYVKLKHTVEELEELMKRMETCVDENKQRVESLGLFLTEKGLLSAEDVAKQETKKSSKIKPAKSAIKGNQQGKRFFSKSFVHHKPNWALKAGYIEKRVLSKLISGCDGLLQIRDNRLQNFAIYPFVDVFDQANSEIEGLIVMSRIDAMTSKSFLKKLENHIDLTKLKVSLHIIPEDKRTDLESLSRSIPHKFKLFICTPELLGRLKDEKVIKPQAVQVMVVYEAEYVFRMPSHLQTIKSVLDEMNNCQVVLACHTGTENVLLAQDALSFDSEKIVFSMDHVHINSANHCYYTDKALTETLLNQAIDKSKNNTVIVVCHDMTEVARLKDQLSSRVQPITSADLAGATGVVSGLLLIPQHTNWALEGKPHADVKMILNLAGTNLTPERYLDMLASYMDLGEPCEVVSKVGSRISLKSIEALGAVFSEITLATAESYQRVGQTISDSQMEQLHSQLDTFRTNLENFARLHRKDIQKDPEFRMHFQKMCGNIGVDPLASSKGYWGELLGVGDFYYELGIQIIDVCLSTRALNGGLMELSEVKRRVERMRGLREDNKSSHNSNTDGNTSSKWGLSLSVKDTSMEITEDDMLRSIKTLAPLGSGFQVLQIGDKKMVSSVPRELNKDQSVILGLVQKTNGHVNANLVVERLGWEVGRTKTALDTLLEDSLMWIDQQAEPHEYWVPGFFEPEDDDIYATTSST
ncbi:hypothetical protein BGX28_006527 [Mortierella sp. GBA30]|nr:hypothetical protein BGX28_006527 [Mortierella sp. GBA30]